MKIIQQRLLRGANMYHALPCIAAIVEADETAANRIADLTLQLQRECGHAVNYARTEPVSGHADQYRVIVEYAIEHVAQASLRTAVELAAQPQPDMAAAVASLRHYATEMGLSPAMQSVAESARIQGFPVLRVSEHAELLTVGWGSRQSRFMEGAGPDNRLLGHTVARDAQLTRALLSEALLDKPDADAGMVAAKIGVGGDEDVLLDQATRVTHMLADAEHGRIPVVAVTGTNGKTTTTLMIAHVARCAGLRTGHTTTTGVFVNGHRLSHGDCTGYWSHRAVLMSPQVDYAVLETARGGILKRGLAYDRCSVGVLLNVSGDHLGLDGVDTVEDLARVKSLVVRSAADAVLNADDIHCVTAQAILAPDTRTIFFSLHADNPVLRAHLEQDGCGVWLEHEVIMLGTGTRRQPVMPVTDIPATVGGLARYNIANALAATAALHATGLSVEQIASGLASFVSDAATNPLRTNIFKVGDVRIVLDYAHNAAAYTALGALTQGMGGSVLAVVSSPGDRRDSDLCHIGACCAEAFDRLFVYESSSRGRPHGEAAELIADGARAAGSRGVETFNGVSDALQRAYRECRAGDVMMFSCGTTIATLIDALRTIDPAAADAVAEQAGA